MEQFINTLKAELQKTLPGSTAQFMMAPFNRSKVDLEKLSSNDYKLSAVMLLFCLDQSNNWFLPLTERYNYLGVHSGQISLPGGKFDATDGTTENTAIRECYEEIGVKDGIKIIGRLTSLFIPVSGFLIEPFVGIITEKDPLFIANEREVKNIIRFQITDLLDHESVKDGSIELPGEAKNLKIKTPYFSLGDYKIWGATAMILSELKAVIKPIF